MPLKNPILRREYHRKYMKDRYNKDEKHRQKQLVRVKTKYKKKVKSCERCGDKNTEGHHPDYTKPNDVIWLCRCCHLDEHCGRV